MLGKGIMKKTATVLLCASMILTFASCSLEPDETTKKTRPSDQVETEESKKTYDDEITYDEISYTEDIVDSQGEKVTFVTTDRDGKTYDESIFAGYELTMINFWEPWCGPCVGEIPDIEELYEDYKDKGLLVIGVYSETTMEDDVDAILKRNNVSYPILRFSNDFSKYQSGYVPTTILVDKNGNIIDTGVSYDGMDSTLIIGSRSYDEWEELITTYLGA